MFFLNRASVLPALAAVIIYAACALILALLVYRQTLDTASGELQAEISADDFLHLAVLQKNQAHITDFLSTLDDSADIAGAALLGIRGSAIARTATQPEGGWGDVSLSQLRRNSGITDTTLTVLAASGLHEDAGSLNSLFSNERPYLTIPVISSASAREGPVTTAAFVDDVYGRRGTNRWVVGYLQVILDGTAMRAPAQRVLLACTGLGLLLLLLGGYAAHLHAARYRKPVKELQGLAADLTDGKPLDEVKFSENPALGDIAIAVKTALKKARDAESAADTERKLLTMKAEERSTRLAEQAQQLDDATAEITATKDELRRVASFDKLTGLPNRSLLLEQLQLLLSSSDRATQITGLLFINLRSFRSVNDSFGHATGDLVLREISKRLVKCLRGDDAGGLPINQESPITVARAGGAEFAVLLENLPSAESAADIAHHVIDHLKPAITISSDSLNVSPSIGIALAPDHGADIDALTRAAGVAMNSIRDTAQKSICLYSEGLETGSGEQFKLEHALREALENDDFTLQYQPQINTLDGSVSCVETLLRWTHADIGEIPPNRFIPIARRTGLMPAIGRWTLREACRQLAAMRSQGLELPRIAVNISVEEIDTDLAPHVMSVLEEYSLDAGSLELGLSELALVDEKAPEVRILRDLNHIGVHLSLDNFGVSAMPLSHLNHCSLHTLHIDRAVVRQCDSDAGKARLIKTIIAIADTLNLQIVAEGVETPEECAHLTSAGARSLQGFLFSAPIPADELEDLLGVPWPYMSLLHSINLGKSATPH